LQSPEALAVHENNNGAVLYVSDTAARCIYVYTVRLSAYNGPQASGQRRVQRGVVATGLAVDGFGNLFYTTGTGDVKGIPAAALAAATAASPEPDPVVLYASGAGGVGGAAVASPAGIASDGFHLYWANTGGDDRTGTVIKATDTLANGDSANATPQAIARPEFRAIAAVSETLCSVATNVCLARDNVYFTGDSPSLLAVKTHGGTIAEVAHGFLEPKGCIYDMENTLYMADTAANTIYSLPATFASLRAVRHARAIEATAPAGLAIVGFEALSRSEAVRVAGAAGPALALAVAAAAVRLAH